MDEELEQGLVDDALPLEEMPASDNLIDATQNAIMGAAENVSHVLEVSRPQEAAPHSAEPFYLEIEFWVGVAFVLAVLVLLKPISKFVKAALQRRVAKVVTDIDEAVKLRDDAQKLLAEYERKFAEAEKETAQIAAKAKQGIDNLRQNEMARLKSESQIKEKEAARRIASSTAKVRDEINSSASRISVDLAQKAIEKYIKNTDKSKLIDEAIAELDKFC